jgi:archaellum component FlaD/FlaE
MKTAATLAQTHPAPQDSLLATVDSLSRRRACDIPEQVIDRFVALRWLAWKGGSLRLTEAGEAMVVTLQAAMLGDQRLAA